MNVSISPRDNYRIEFVVRCLAVEGDGLGSHELCDGGVLGTVMAAGFKGKELELIFLKKFLLICILADYNYVGNK